MTSLLHFIVCLPLKADGEASTGGGVRFPGRPTPPLSTSKPFTFTRFAASFEDEIETMAAHAKYGRFLTHRQIDGDPGGASRSVVFPRATQISEIIRRRKQRR